MKLIYVYVLSCLFTLVLSNNHASRAQCPTPQDAKISATMFVKCDPRYDSSNCPDEKWLQLFRDSDAQKTQKEGYKLVNIGFNKGYNFATWLNVFAPSIGIDVRKWHEELKVIPALGEDDRCGSCNDCKAPPVNPTKLSADVLPVEPKLHIIGVDINKGNIDTVNTVLAALRRTQRVEDRLVVELVHAAGGYVLPGASKTLKMPKCNVGNEICSMPTGTEAPVDDSKYELIPIVGVDELVRELQFIDLMAGKGALSAGEHPLEAANSTSTHSFNAHHTRRGELRAYSTNVIDILHIDTEGNDPDVLKSATGLLESHRIRAVIFEYHKFRLWGKTKLSEVVESIVQHNMECFFMGTNRLWPISGKCWDPQYEFHEWSNVICVLRSDPWYQAIQPIIRTHAAEVSKYNGTVARAPRAREIFFLQDGKRHGFNSWDAFVNKGFGSEDIKTVDSCVLFDLLSKGDPIV